MYQLLCKLSLGFLIGFCSVQLVFRMIVFRKFRMKKIETQSKPQRLVAAGSQTVTNFKFPCVWIKFHSPGVVTSLQQCNDPAYHRWSAYPHLWQPNCCILPSHICKAEEVLITLILLGFLFAAQIGALEIIFHKQI